MFNFERLEVWNEAVHFSDLIYKLTGRFPVEERFGLTNQLRRASVSIAANIAEGSSPRSSKDFMRFIEMAYGSLMEAVSHLAIAHRQSFLPESDQRHLYEMAERLGRMLSGLRQSLKS